MTIAQRFNVGSLPVKAVSPEGTAELRCSFSRPFGTDSEHSGWFPTLKRWAIIGCPSGTEPMGRLRISKSYWYRT